jgi:hypothetical protein
MNEPQEFAHSTNGDRWFIEPASDGHLATVIHRGNLPSGGHETRIPVDAFLGHNPRGPEHEALERMLSALPVGNSTIDAGTASGLSMLAHQYLRLGGRRSATRAWGTDTKEAADFWDANIAVLDDGARREVELYLPMIEGP